MRTLFAAALLLSIPIGTAESGDVPPRPKAADGWSIELVEQAPAIAYPTACVVGPDGTIYLGQDPMDMPGPPTVPADSVVAIRDGRVTKFADKLWAVMGLEWVDGTLFVVHAPYLSALRDLDGDGKADSRVDLITGLGPKLPGFNGINDHIASGIRLGIDGFLYISIGDKGLPRATARDGTTITMAGGGVMRIRPDGSGLELVSTGERNPLSVALTAHDDIFTYGNDDDSKKWPNSLTHHIVGGHYGYPYEFLTAPFRALPIIAGQFGGSGTQGICYTEDGLPSRFQGNLFFCDWGLQKLIRYEVAPSGASFEVVKQETVVEKGDLVDFRPFSVACSADGSSLYLVDWAFNGWLADGPPAGRLFRLTYTGADRVTPGLRPSSNEIAVKIRALDHPALSVRRDAQRALAGRGLESIRPLTDRLQANPGPGRIHALWALDSISGPEARRAIRASLTDQKPTLQAQAARSSGIARDREAVPALAALLRSTDPTVRRDSAIALGQIGDPAGSNPLYLALGDPDPVVSWSVRKALRKLGAENLTSLNEALADPKRREDALKLADESWTTAAVTALSMALDSATDSSWKARVLAALAGNYRRYPEWSGQWFGTNPLAGAPPKKTRDWSPEGMTAVLTGLIKGLRDPDPLVRRPAIVGLIGVGEQAAPLLRMVLEKEPDPVNQAVAAQALGSLNDLRSIPLLSKILLDGSRPIEVRSVALDALAAMNSPQALNARLMLVYDAKAPESLLARALPALGRSRVLPANDLAGFFENSSELVRAAALAGFPVGKPLPVNIRSSLVDRLDDPSPVVRKAAIGAVASQKLAEAIPRLIKLGADETYRSEASRALAEMPDPRAFPVYVESLGDRDPAVRQASETALRSIREIKSTELRKLAGEGKFVGPAALAVERILTKFQPVPAWKVIGPFPRTTPLLFEDPAAIDFAKTQVGAEGRAVTWQNRSAEPTTGRITIDDFKAGTGDHGGFGYDANGSPDLAAFAYAEVSSDRDRQALMIVGSSGTIQISVNHQAVLNYTNSVGRPYSPESNVVRFSLQRGVNRILVRSRQGIGTWSFSLSISDPTSAALVGTSGAIGLEGLRAFALSHQGDPVNGERLFFESKGIGCSGCHTVGGQGTANVGPDLTGLAAKYQKSEIIRSVLEPSNRLATGFQPLLISRHDGTVVTGLLRAETDDSVELTDAHGKPILIRKVEIDQRKVSESSLMPAGLVDSLAPVEFADLIAYLNSLKSTR